MDSIGVMSPSEGAAWRCQLDGMLGVLLPLTAKAGGAGDQPVIALLAALQDARTAAVKIENRQAAPPVRKGVSLLRK